MMYTFCIMHDIINYIPRMGKPNLKHEIATAFTDANVSRYQELLEARPGIEALSLSQLHTVIPQIQKQYPQFKPSIKELMNQNWELISCSGVTLLRYISKNRVEVYETIEAEIPDEEYTYLYFSQIEC